MFSRLSIINTMTLTQPNVFVLRYLSAFQHYDISDIYATCSIYSYQKVLCTYMAIVCVKGLTNNENSGDSRPAAGGVVGGVIGGRVESSVTVSGQS